MEEVMKKRVIARLFIKEGSVAAFKKRAASIIQTTRVEKGCIFYSLFQDVNSPGEFLFYEEYEDQAALDCHFKSTHLQAFRNSTKDMFSKDKIVEVV
jgi:quinol monooxygenase YgiN